MPKLLSKIFHLMHGVRTKCALKVLLLIIRTFDLHLYKQSQHLNMFREKFYTLHSPERHFCPKRFTISAFSLSNHTFQVSVSWLLQLLAWSRLFPWCVSWRRRHFFLPYTLQGYIFFPIQIHDLQSYRHRNVLTTTQKSCIFWLSAKIVLPVHSDSDIATSSA